MNDFNSIAQLDRLLLLAPREPANFGVVAAPEELGDFSEGDVVGFTSPERIQDCENGSFVFVSPAKCEKITDPALAEMYRTIIYGGCQMEGKRRTRLVHRSLIEP